MSATVTRSLSIDEAMRAHHRDHVLRSGQGLLDGHDPADPSDRGPHVDRVGLIAVDTDFAPDEDDIDPPPDASPA